MQLIRLVLPAPLGPNDRHQLAGRHVAWRRPASAYTPPKRSEIPSISSRCIRTLEGAGTYQKNETNVRTTSRPLSTKAFIPSWASAAAAFKDITSWA